jgi:phage tail protein X
VAIIGFELHKVTSDYVAVDLIIWKRYKAQAQGMVELFMDANPQIAYVHRTTPFLPPGTYVRVPIDPALVLGKPPMLPQDSLWTDREGYTIGVGNPPTAQIPATSMS